MHLKRGATRRAVLGGCSATLTIGSFAVWAQPRNGPRRLGVLMAQLASDPTGQAFAAVLVQGLGAHDWKEGGNLRIDWRWTGGDRVLYERYAAELVSLRPDVILGTSSPFVATLRRQTATIPIVFVSVTDPVGQGFVASLARPGGNVTGFSNYDPPMAGKWLEMLTQITPPVARAAVLYNASTAPYADLMLHAIEEAARSLGVTVRAAPYRDDAGIEATMAGLARDERGGLLVLPDISGYVHREAIVVRAARYRLPAVYPFRYFTVLGGLMSYGIENVDMYRRAAAYVDRILKGAVPGDLPVQAPTKFETVINSKTAKVLGITIPPVLIAQADEVIE